MALTPPIVTGAILAAGPELKGENWFRIATVVGTAVSVWAQVPANLALTGVTQGTVGAGAVTGKITVAPNPAPVLAAAVSVGLLGFVTPSVCRAVGMGVAAAVTASGQYIGTSAGVAVGTDISKVSVANPATLTGTISSIAASTGLLGLSMQQLSAAFGTGLSVMLLTGAGTGVVAGVAGPSPGFGTSVSRVV